MAKLKSKPVPRKQQCNKCAEYFNPDTIDGAVHLASCRMYNGYKNYETWVVSLWIDNDRGSYEYWRDTAKEALQDAKENPPKLLIPNDSKRTALRTLSDRLKEEITESCEGNEGLASDLMGAALSEVDWYEIAENMLEE